MSYLLLHYFSKQNLIMNYDCRVKLTVRTGYRGVIADLGAVETKVRRKTSESECHLQEAVATLIIFLLCE